MRVIFAALISLTAIIGCATYDTDTPRGSSISVKNIGQQQVTISGHADPIYELVLRIEKSKHTKQLEWTSTLDGTFEAELSATDKLPLRDEKFGKGIVFKVTRAGNGGGTVGSTVNIALSDQGPVPNGVVRFRTKQPESKKLPALKQVGNTIVIADIVCDDGTEIPVSVLVRERGQTTKP